MKSNRNNAIASAFKRNALVIAVAATAFSVAPTSAQDTDSGIMLEEVVVTGTLRDTIRNSIELKRQSSTIVDAISASDIGVLPDLSVAETLERITGVTGDRFKGNASEISIRGLGPFLVSSTFNGREVSSGSGNRAVAFSQFPSELVNKAVVYKAQQADILEGGVAGSIDLGVIRPIDYGKRRIQGEFRANYNEYQDKINDDSGVGYRGSLSYTDVFDTDSFGTFGLALGFASVDGSAPQEAYVSSSSLRPCNSAGGNNCSFDSTNPRRFDEDGNPVFTNEFYLIPNQLSFRQQESEETRDSVMATVQWQPNDDWDIAVDYLFSNRFYFEDRHELFIDEGRRGIDDWISTDSGELLAYSGLSRIGTYGDFRERDEDYTSFGLNIGWQATDKLKITTDLSYSETERQDDIWQTRFRSDRVNYDFRDNGDKFPQITDFYTNAADRQASSLGLDIVNDFSFFDLDNRARAQNNLTEDMITAFELNGEYDIDGDFFTSVKAGVRLSEHETNFYARASLELSKSGGSADTDLATVGDSCLREFPQSGFGDDAGANISEWATYDTLCAFNILAGENNLIPDSLQPSADDVLLQEDITSVFAMANFDSEIAGVPVSGNFGVRVVNTEISSETFRTDLFLSRNDVSGSRVDADGNPNPFRASEINIRPLVVENDYVNVLPSLNLNFSLTDEVQLRAALYRSMSRPDMFFMGYGLESELVREANENNPRDGQADTAEELIADTGENFYNAFGNFEVEALESDNFDLSLGFYPDEDTSISFALYYKKFNAGFEELEGLTQQTTFVIQDSDSADPALQTTQTLDLPVNGRVSITDEESTITGAEITIQHAFSYLPEPLNGLGISAGYNYADTDFETPERSRDVASQLGEFQDINPLDDVDGMTAEENRTLNDFISPASLPGFSRESYSLETYWENYGWQARVAYKYRSQYLKPFGNTLNQSNRFVADTGTVDASLSYRITDALTLRFQVLNATNEPYVENRVLESNTSLSEYSGRKFFAGVKFRL